MNDWIVSEYLDVIRVSAVEPLTNFKVRVRFSDDSEREIDLAPYLQGPIFAPVRRDPAFFRQVYIDHGAVAWPNGADIDTDTLYYGDNPPWAIPAPNISTRTGRATPVKRRAILSRTVKSQRKRVKVKTQ
jgi:hypothetical protein